MMYGLIIWYRKKDDMEVKRYAALFSDYCECLSTITKYKKNYVLITAVIENQLESNSIYILKCSDHIQMMTKMMEEAN